MARPLKSRKIFEPPRMIGFKPYGLLSAKREKIILSYEGFESIKLVNYEMLSQEEAANKMNVSRPTLTRIYNRALKIIAKAFAEGKAIEIEGGNCHFDRDWYRCRRCYKLIEGLENHDRCSDCPAYSESELIKIG